MASSPDKLHAVRDNVADIKSKNRCLNLMELKAHLLMLNEYDDLMLRHYLELEKIYRPLPQLIAQQPEIKLKMRYLVIDYLLDIVNKFKLASETFFTAVQMIDRYASVRIIKKSQFQLVGLCCLWISSKFHEKKQNVPTLDDLTKLCCNCYSKKLFINMETHILSSVGWCVGGNLESMLDMFIQKNKLYNLADVKVACIYICQLVQFYKLSLNYKNSHITCAALSLVLRAFNGSSSSSLNDLELMLLRLLEKPSPSSMIDQSLSSVIVQLKKYYHYSDVADHEDRQQQLQLLTPPSSATGSIDAGNKKYIVSTLAATAASGVPQTPFLYNDPVTNKTSTSRSTSFNSVTSSPHHPAVLRSRDIYPSPIEAVTPPISLGMKRSFASLSSNEVEMLPIFKKKFYNPSNENTSSIVASAAAAASHLYPIGMSVDNSSLSTVASVTTSASTSVPPRPTTVSVTDENITNNDDFFYEY